MPDSIGLESHQSSASRIGGNGIVCQHNLAQRARRSVQLAITFHRNDSVRYNDVDWHCGADIENALLNAFRVQNVFWLTVS